MTAPMSRRTLLSATAAMAAMAVVGAPGRAAAQAARRSPENLFLSDNGVRVAGFSSEYGSGWEAANLVPARADLDPSNAIVRPLIWSSAPDAPFPHWILFEFPGRQWITHLVFDNYLEEEADHPGISSKDIEIWTGDDSNALRRAASLTLARNQQDQAVRVEPVETRYVRIVIASNYGHPWYTELNALQAFDDGSRPDDIAARLQADGAVDLYGLYFDFGSANLRAESRPVLDQIAAFARAHPGQSLLIEGHTDSVGGKDANLRLSQARADAVLAALVKQGVSAALLTSRGYGADEPVASNATTAGRASNRRVTLRLQGQAS